MTAQMDLFATQTSPQPVVRPGRCPHGMTLLSHCPLCDEREPWRPDADIPHTDRAVPADARPRLGGQNARTLARLREGPVTNAELERLHGVGRVNSRIADVRAFLRETEGNDVETTAVDTAAGLYRYEIVPWEGEG